MLTMVKFEYTVLSYSNYYNNFKLLNTMKELMINLCRLAIMMFLGWLISTLFGAFAGWVVGLFFGKTILAFFAALGITGFKMWQIGAVLGFVGGFFRNSISVKN